MRRTFLAVPAVAVTIGVLAWWSLTTNNDSQAAPVQAPALVAGSGSDEQAAPTEASSEKATPAKADIPQATLTASTLPKMGEAVTDEAGWILYRFDKDTANPSVSNCVDECAEKWPPVLTDGKPKLNGVDPSLVSTIQRADGTQQVTLGNWPLYRFAGDPAPGKWKGQGLQGVWFVAAPDGTRNTSCLPDGVQAPAEQPADPAPANEGGGY